MRITYIKNHPFVGKVIANWMIEMLYDAQIVENVYKRSKKSVIALISPDSHIEILLKKTDEFDIKIISDDDTTNTKNLFINSNAPDIFLICMKDYNLYLIKKVLEIRDKTKVPISVISEHYDNVLALTVFKFGADEYWTDINSPKQIMNKISMTIIKNSIGMYSREGRIEVIKKDTASNKDRDVSFNKPIIYTKLLNIFTSYEYKVLSFLVENAGVTVSRSQLASIVRGRISLNTDRSVVNVISRIRKKLKTLYMSEYSIKSFSSVGYVFIGDSNRFFKDLSNAVNEYLDNE